MKTKKKRFAAILLSICMLLGMIPISAQDVFAAEGSGTADDPYLIITGEDLKTISGGGYYKLMKDIALTGEWTPIASFSGTLDGDGHKISGVTVSRTNPRNGFIETLASSGTVKNLAVSGTVTCLNTGNCGGQGTGGIVGYNNGTIADCIFYGTVSQKQGDNMCVAGIAGYNAGTISHCINRGDITGISTGGSYDAVYVGGIAGSNHGSVEISNCINEGTIFGSVPNTNTNIGEIWGSTTWKSNGAYVGGIAGDTNNANAPGCSNIGTVIGENSNEDTNLISIAAPEDIKLKVPATWLQALLPQTLTLETTQGVRSGTVTWNTDSYDANENNTSYDFSGTVTLPEGIKNPNDVSLNVTIHVVVGEPAPVEHIHCVCGGSTNVGDHTAHSDVTYQTLDSSFTGGKLQAGSYYLTEDITLNSDIDIGGHVNLCLNGHTIDTGNYAVRNENYYGSSTFNIADCKETGMIKGSRNRIIVHVNGTTNLYNIVVEGTDAGVYCGKGNTNIYGGSVKGGRDGILTVDNSTLNIYGGEISGPEYGIYVAGSNPVLNITGDTTVINGSRSDICLTSYIATINMGGVPTISTIEKQERSSKISAVCNGQVYTGGDIKIKPGINVKVGDVIVSDVTEGVNNEKFSVTDDTKYLVRKGTDLILTEDHIHCICGGSTNAGDHTAHKDVTYEMLDRSFTGGELTAGNYYLTADVTLDSKISISGNVNLCLNGYKINTGNHELEINGDSAELTITNCKGTGAIQGNTSYLIANKKGTTNLFNTTVETTDSYGVRIAGGEINVYSGTVKAALSGIYAGGGTLNIHGGTITAPSNGVFASSAVVNITGGTVQATDSSLEPADVNLNDNATLHLGGTPNISKIKFEDSNQISAQIFAKCGEKNYTGGTIQLQSHAFNANDIGNIIVSDVTQDTNDGSFSLADEGYCLKLDGTNLIVARNTHSVTLPETQTGYTLTAETGSTSPVNHGDSFTFQFALTDGYSKTDGFAVKVNGEPVTLADSGSYTISNITKDTTVTVEGVADITAPAGEIIIGTDKWHEFLNNITFGKFFKDTQSVTVTAADAGSSVDKIYYYIADSAKTEEELKAFTGWEEYTAAFNIEPNDKYIIYVKMTDNDENTAYINTDGLVLDNVVPVISGIVDGKTYCEAQKFTVVEENLDKVMINGTEVSAVEGEYTVSPAKGEQEIVVTDLAGNEVSYTVTVNDGHTFSYVAEENTITEICAYCSHKETATITATDAAYEGSSLETASVAYTSGWEGGTLTIAYKNNNGVGKATASITRDGATAAVDFNITAGCQTAPTGVGKIDETIDGKADGALTGVDNTMEYRREGENTYTAITGTTAENLADGTYYVRYAENDNYNASPDSEAVVIAAGRKLSVNFVVDDAVIETKQVSWNGSVDAMPDIPAKTGYDKTPPAWDKTLADLTGIQKDITVTAQYTINRYTVLLISGEGYTVEAVGANTVNHGEQFTFKVEVDEGYSKTDEFAVWYQGIVIAPNADGSYTITVLTDLDSPAVLGVADNTAPTGEITIDTNKWHEFLNNITFGLFFKDTQSVEITAADAGSGMDTIGYYLAENEMTLAEVRTITNWQEYKDGLYIEPNHEYIIYVKLTDNAGNVSYINSNGIVLDNILPAISGIENGKTYCEAVEVTVDEAYVGTVSVNGKAVALSDGKFTVVPAEGEQTIVVIDKAGNYVEKTITVNNGHTWGKYSSNRDATCSKDGTKTAKCRFCNAEDTVADKGSMLAHTYGKWTDAKDGRHHIRTCSCGAVETEVHKWDGGKVTKKATTTQKGERTDTCQVCGAVKVEEIPKLSENPKPSETPKHSETPQTGDNSNIAWWIAVLFAAGAGAAGAVLYRRKKAK